jgi:hypothetical protein
LNTIELFGGQMVEQYRKKPAVIQAVKYDGSSTHRSIIEAWIANGVYHDSSMRTRDIGPMSIQTLEGEITAQPGDYIIQGVAGEFYPCKPDIFEETYEKVYQDKEG